MLRAYGEGKVFGEPFGEGPVRVLWLHGWARSSHDFTTAATRLAEQGIASVALDLPGFGASPAPTVAGGARHYAELLAPVLTEMGDEPLVLVGHSFGGRVATVLAATHPDRVGGLVLTGVPLLARSGSRSRSPWRFRLAKQLHARHLLSDQRMEAARQRFGSRDYRALTGVMRDVLVASVNESYQDELARVTAPVTMVWGMSDLDVPLDIAERATTLLPGTSSLVRLPGVGHMVPLEDPGCLVESARGLLS